MTVVHSPLGQRWHAAWQKVLQADAAEGDAPAPRSPEYDAAYEEFLLVDEETVRAPFENPSDALTKVDSALRCAWTTVPPDELEAEGWLLVRTGRDLLVNGYLAHAIVLFRQGHSQAREHLGEEGVHVAWRQVHEAIIALDRSFGLDPSAPTVVEGPDAKSVPPVAKSRRKQINRIDYSASDNLLVDEMISMIQRGDARNRWDAARALSSRAEGMGSDESKAKRLHKRLQERLCKLSRTGHDGKD